ncbi:AraC family transcriptional regulator [Conexibacter arvalis]|uniref:AraC-like DNA-binding protein n=1 Tax=Conexibacter arvalis TaxID=912552 RepID=A0A840IAI0_9ACTN|nr:helix-turn-helix domain-containing protein [Conexibacter arvalis]MBB4661261.1 AraC-like DNA-binding protein [Conexibacter arvalis]
MTRRAAPLENTRGILAPASVATTFRLARFPVAPDLAHAVERHWTVAWDLRGRAPFTQEILNHPNVNLSIEPEGAFVWGVGTTRTRHRLDGRGWVLGTRFRAGGFRAFAGIPVARLTDRVVPLAELFGVADAAALERAVRAGEGPEERIALVEAFLRERDAGPDPRVAEVAAIVRMLLDDPSITRVDQLARRCHLSARTLQRLFHDYVGVSPKWVVQRQRLHTAAERIADEPGLDLGRLALDLGYFDQAHFINEFKAVVGRPPAEYAAACAAISALAA